MFCFCQLKKLSWIIKCKDIKICFMFNVKNAYCESHKLWIPLYMHVPHQFMSKLIESSAMLMYINCFPVLHTKVVSWANNRRWLPCLRVILLVLQKCNISFKGFCICCSHRSKVKGRTSVCQSGDLITKHLKSIHFAQQRRFYEELNLLYFTFQNGCWKAAIYHCA